MSEEHVIDLETTSFIIAKRKFKLVSLAPVTGTSVYTAYFIEVAQGA